jgi:hypothetical protein
MTPGRILGLVVAALMLGCGNTANNMTPTIGTATLSGALSGTVSESAWAYAEPLADYLWFNVASDSEPEVVFGSKIPGTSLGAGTFTGANVTFAPTTVTFSASDAGVWLQQFDSSTSTQQGNFSLTIASVGPAPPVAPSALVAAHTRLSGVTAALPSSSGNRPPPKSPST